MFDMSIAKVFDDCLGVILNSGTSFGLKGKQFYKSYDADNLL